MNKRTTLYTCLLAMVTLLACIIILFTSHNKWVIYGIAVLTVFDAFFIIGLLFTTFFCEERKVFRFMHLYVITDPLDNETVIMSELTKKDITRLKEHTVCDRLEKIFQSSAVLIEAQYKVKYKNKLHRKIVGWVYAHDEDEALRTLHYENFADNVEANEEVNTQLKYTS